MKLFTLAAVTSALLSVGVSSVAAKSCEQLREQELYRVEREEGNNYAGNRQTVTHYSSSM